MPPCPPFSIPRSVFSDYHLLMLSFHSTRLAPSPTGALHLGHARTFLITWVLARQAGAKIFMRMDDIDATRAKADAVQQAYDDLRWLGLDWEAYDEEERSQKTEDRRQRVGEVVQSQRLGLYESTLEALWPGGAVYPCICTRADIAAAVVGAASAPHEVEVAYPGTCRGRFPGFASTGLTALQTAADILAATGKAPCFRLRVADASPIAPATHATPTPPTFTDLFAGPQSTNAGANGGDFPLTRFAQSQLSDHPVTLSPRHALTLPPAYQLACVADDHAMGIDLVIRGDDLLPSTPRQLLLYRALGWQPPRFLHVPLVVGPDGKRLAKRHGESRIAQFRAAGVSAQRIIGWAAWRAGQIPVPRVMAAADLVATFDLTRLPPHRITLTPEDLAWLR
jgi:glutamyl-tRNA synthetase